MRVPLPPPPAPALIRYPPPPSRVFESLDRAIAACRDAPPLKDRGEACREALEDLRAEVRHDLAVRASREAVLACAMGDDPGDPFDCEGSEA